MRIAIYARKSTEGEDRQVQSLEDQIGALTQLAQRESLRIGEIFQEARSAKEPGKRPEFDRMIRAIEDGSVTAILTWSVNRLSRNAVDGGSIAHLLQTGRLDYIRTPERTYRPEDNALLLSIENGMAIAFLQDLRRNVKRGMRGRVERGWHISKAPVGYKNDLETREIIPDSDRFDLVRRAWDLMLTGNYSLSAVHKEMRKLGLTVRARARSGSAVSRTRFFQIFRDPFFMGLIRFNGETLPGKHVPMVTREEFQAVARILGDKHKAKKPRTSKWSFSNTMRCAVCGCAIVGDVRRKYFARTKRTAEYIYYHCSGAKGCRKTGVREEILAEEIEPLARNLRLLETAAEWLKQALVEAVESEMISTVGDITKLESQQHAQEKRIQRLNLMRLDGEITSNEFVRMKGDLLDESAQLRETISKARFGAGDKLHFIYERIDAAVKAGELLDRYPDPAALGYVLKLAGEHVLNLVTLTFQLDPTLEKISAFRPPKFGSESPKLGERKVALSAWSTLVHDLLSTATDQMAKIACADAQKSIHQRRADRRFEERRRRS